MNTHQKAQLSMIQQVMLVFLKFAKLFGTIKPLGKKMDAFDTLHSQLEDYIKQHGINTGGTTSLKDLLKQIMIHKVMVLVCKVRPWLSETNNPALANLFLVSDSNFKGDEQIAVALAESILKFIGDNISDLADYNVTAANLTDADTSVAQFKAKIGTPKEQKSISKIAKMNIGMTLISLIDILEKCDDLVVGNFIDSNPQEVDEYKASRKVGSSVGQHTTVLVHVYADAAHTEPIVGASISIDVLNRHDDTDVDGKAEIIKFKAGTYKLGVAAAGYADTSVSFTVKNGKHVELDVVLIPLPTGAKGTVIQNGKPAAGLSVSIVGTNYTTVTDANGNYIFSHLPAGNYTIEVSNAGGDSVTASLVVVVGVMSVVDLVL